MQQYPPVQGTGPRGPRGWTPVMGSEVVGAQTFVKVIDWTGGKLPKPALGYVGPSGLVATVDEATSFAGRGVASLTAVEDSTDILVTYADGSTQVVTSYFAPFVAAAADVTENTLAVSQMLSMVEAKRAEVAQNTQSVSQANAAFLALFPNAQAITNAVASTLGYRDQTASLVQAIQQGVPKGPWSAATNTPALTATPNPAFVDGAYYKVQGPGVMTFAGLNFAVGQPMADGDSLWKLGTQWFRIAQSDLALAEARRNKALLQEQNLLNFISPSPNDGVVTGLAPNLGTLSFVDNDESVYPLAVVSKLLVFTPTALTGSVYFRIYSNAVPTTKYNATFGFWVNKANLTTAGANTTVSVQFRGMQDAATLFARNASTFKASEMVEGASKTVTFGGADYVTRVLAVVGNYAFICFSVNVFEVPVNKCEVYVLLAGMSSLAPVTFANPTLLLNRTEVNPYFVYPATPSGQNLYKTLATVVADVANNTAKAARADRALLDLHSYNRLTTAPNEGLATNIVPFQGTLSFVDNDESVYPAVVVSKLLVFTPTATSGTIYFRPHAQSGIPANTNRVAMGLWVNGPQLLAMGASAAMKFQLEAYNASAALLFAKESATFTAAEMVVGASKLTPQAGVDYMVRVAATYGSYRYVEFVIPAFEQPPTEIRLYVKLAGLTTAALPVAFANPTVLYNRDEVNPYFVYTTNPAYRNLYKKIDELSTAIPPNQWQGKKILWLGTSIPDLGGYIEETCAALGATLIKETQSGSCVRVSKSDGTPMATSQHTQSLARTQAEYDALGLSANRNNSYEKKLLTHLDADLVIFEHGFNDLADQAIFDQLPADTRDRKYFVGGMNYLVDRLLEAKPRARFAFVGHHENIGSSTIKLAAAHDLLASYWSRPICRVYQKMGFSGQVVPGTGVSVRNTYLPDGIHPHLDVTGQTAQIYKYILLDFLRGIY